METMTLRGAERAAGWAALILAGSVTACGGRTPPAELTPAEVETTLFLIGDAGAPDPHQVGAPLDSLAAQAAAAPGRTYVVFLGDNVYPEGVPREGAPEWKDARRRLAAQVRAVPDDARGLFIAGNHDWSYGEAFGLYAVRLQEAMIADLAGEKDVALVPGNGCPGPTVVDEGRLRLVLVDTQWWLHDFIVHDEETDCTRDKGTVTAALRGAVRPPREDGITVVLGHHPLITGGKHGGYCGVTGPFHRFGGRSQDIMSTANRTMRDSLESAFAAHPPLVYAAGHEHNLQVLRGGPAVQHLLVSGAGAPSKVACAVRLRESHYVSQNRVGYMRLDILKDRGVLLSVYRYTSDGTGGRSYTQWLEPR
jgi:hypothetical protein